MAGGDYETGLKAVHLLDCLLTDPWTDGWDCFDAGESNVQGSVMTQKISCSTVGIPSIPRYSDLIRPLKHVSSTCITVVELCIINLLKTQGCKMLAHQYRLEKTYWYLPTCRLMYLIASQNEFENDSIWCGPFAPQCFSVCQRNSSVLSTQARSCLWSFSA